MDIENHRHPSQLRVPCGKHEEIRDVVNVNDIVGLLQMTTTQPRRTNG